MPEELQMLPPTDDHRLPREAARMRGAQRRDSMDPSAAPTVCLAMETFEVSVLQLSGGPEANSSTDLQPRAL